MYWMHWKSEKNALDELKYSKSLTQMTSYAHWHVLIFACSDMHQNIYLSHLKRLTSTFLPITFLGFFFLLKIWFSSRFIERKKKCIHQNDWDGKKEILWELESTTLKGFSIIKSECCYVKFNVFFNKLISIARKQGYTGGCYGYFRHSAAYGNSTIWRCIR